MPRVPQPAHEKHSLHSAILAFVLVAATAGGCASSGSKPDPLEEVGRLRQETEDRSRALDQSILVKENEMLKVIALERNSTDADRDRLRKQASDLQRQIDSLRALKGMVEQNTKDIRSITEADARQAEVLRRLRERLQQIDDKYPDYERPVKRN